MRFKKSCQPNEIKNEYQPDTTFSITLPRGIIDLHTFTLYYKANPANYKHIETVDTTTSITFLGQDVNAINDTIVYMGHGLANGTELKYFRGGSTSIRLADNAFLYVVGATANSFQLSLSLGGAPVDLIGGTAGEIHTLKFVNRSYRTIRRFLPRLSSSIISDLIIKINNQEEIQNTREYNMLFAILNDLTKEYDDIDSTSPDTVQEHLYTASGSISNISKIQAVSRDAANTDKYFPSNKVSYFIDKWAGFLNEGNRYFDAREKDVKIIFRLAPANILYRGINSIDTPGADIVVNNIIEYQPDYVISDIRASVDLLDDMPDMPQFIYNDYQYVQGNYLPNNKVSTTSFETNKPVNWVLGTFSHPDRLKDQELILQHCHNNTTRYGSQVKNSLTLAEINSKSQNSTLYSYELAKTHKEAYLLNSSGYFLRSGDGILSTKYKLNNYELCPDTDIISCYSESKKLFNTPYKKVQNMYSFESEFFCNAIAIDDNSEDSYKRIDWEVHVDPSKTNRLGGYPMLFYSFKNKL